VNSSLKVLITSLFLGVISCNSAGSLNSQERIFQYEDLTKRKGKLSFDVDNNSMVIDNHTTQPMTYCNTSSNFHCVLIDSKVYVAWPRGIKFEALESWEYMGQKFKVQKRMKSIYCGSEKNVHGVLISTVAENGYVWNFGVSSNRKVFFIGSEVQEEQMNPEFLALYLDTDFLPLSLAYFPTNGCGMIIP